MKNIFILAADDHSIKIFWPGKIDTINTNIFANTTQQVNSSKNAGVTYATRLDIIIYTCICVVITILIVKKILTKNIK